MAVAAEHMSAVVLDGPHDLRLTEVARPRIARARDVLIDVALSGVCGTDLHAIHSPDTFGVPAGTILGHEIVGTVRAVGPEVENVAVGQRVVVAPNVHCGWCDHCRLGLTNQCRNRRTYGFTDPGGFASHVVVDAVACYPIAQDLPDREAVLAEPLSTVIASLRQGEPFPGEVAVVIGGGPIGLMHAVLLTGAGLTVIVVEPSAPRAAIADELDVAVVSQGPDRVLTTVDRETGGLGADLVIDTAGTQLDLASRIVRPGGRIVLFGVAPGFEGIVPVHHLQEREARVTGCLIGRNTFLPAVRMLEQRRFDFGPILPREVPIEELIAAVERQRSHQILKAAVRFEPNVSSNDTTE